MLWDCKSISASSTWLCVRGTSKIAPFAHSGHTSQPALRTFSKCSCNSCELKRWAVICGDLEVRRQIVTPSAFLASALLLNRASWSSRCSNSNASCSEVSGLALSSAPASSELALRGRSSTSVASIIPPSSCPSTASSNSCSMFSVFCWWADSSSGETPGSSFSTFWRKADNSCNGPAAAIENSFERSNPYLRSYSCRDSTRVFNGCRGIS
mmetsp:Transcript_17004/g.27012  ORF Transcript_17004/g.27012 Transcript_17004/m.27012 type:complete len:211 (-) Transcript_17004:224-856(-)